jgi:acetyl/propionyl-CoA carboxylase alpha subunit
VEHPVTELVAGIDLVLWQIRIAAGEALPFTQAELSARGHALECRLYAEDPARDFLPATGEIGLFRRPSGPHVRLDNGISAGMIITPYYDPLLAKLITWGETRAQAIARMRRALQETIVLGVTTNIPYLLDILAHAEFVAGRTPTRFLTDHFAAWAPDPAISEEVWLAAAAFELLGSGPLRPVGAAEPPIATPWEDGSGWRNGAGE